MADRDTIIDAGREGYESGRRSERADIVEYLHNQATVVRYLTRGKDPELSARADVMDLLAANIETGLHFRPDSA